MTLASVTTHVDDGLAHLIGQYKDKPRLAAWITSYLLEVQALSNAAWDVLVLRTLDEATNAQLTVLGKLVGQSRRGETDARYKQLITARIAANRSNGKPDEMINIASLILDSVPFELLELFPASFIVDVSGQISFADLLHEVLLKSKGAGVAMSVHWFTEHDEDACLTWSAGDSFEDDDIRGFGGDDPEGGIGGLLIGAF